MSQKAISLKKTLSVIERYLLPNVPWQEGFRDFNKLLGRPECWLFISPVTAESKLIQLDRKGSISSGPLSSEKTSTAHFLKKFSDK